MRTDGGAVVSGPIVWTPERDAQLIALIEKGLTFNGAARELGSSRDGVRQALRRLRAEGRGPTPKRGGVRNEPMKLCACGARLSGKGAGRSSQCLPCFNSVRVRNAPDDFAEQAETKGTNALSAYYGASKKIVRRWFAETGAKKLPPQIVGNTKPRTEKQLAVSRRSYPGKVGSRPVGGSAADRTFHAVATEIHRDTSVAGMAADHLRRIAPVYRCDERGRQDVKGALWRVGNGILTDAEVIARAERKGWQSDAWQRLAA